MGHQSTYTTGMCLSSIDKSSNRCQADAPALKLSWLYDHQTALLTRPKMAVGDCAKT